MGNREVNNTILRRKRIRYVKEAEYIAEIKCIKDGYLEIFQSKYNST